jgi:hypothetical protein
MFGGRITPYGDYVPLCFGYGDNGPKTFYVCLNIENVKNVTVEDGMDMLFPLDTSNFIPTHRTTSNLNLRYWPDTRGDMVTMLPKGTAVQVLENATLSAIGHITTEGKVTKPNSPVIDLVETTDGITAPWVKVLSEDGYMGWCFSGYLDPPVFYIQAEETVTVEYLPETGTKGTSESLAENTAVDQKLPDEDAWNSPDVYTDTAESTGCHYTLLFV